MNSREESPYRRKDEQKARLALIFFFLTLPPLPPFSPPHKGSHPSKSKKAHESTRAAGRVLGIVCTVDRDEWRGGRSSAAINHSLCVQYTDCAGTMPRCRYLHVRGAERGVSLPLPLPSPQYPNPHAAAQQVCMHIQLIDKSPPNERANSTRK